MASTLRQLATFSHPDFTVGTGFTPAQPHLRLVDLPFGFTTGRELAGASSLTLPRRSTVGYWFYLNTTLFVSRLQDACRPNQKFRKRRFPWVCVSTGTLVVAVRLDGSPTHLWKSI